MKKENLLMSFLLLAGLNLISAQIDNESNFYTPIAHANYNKDLVADYGVDNSFTTDDSGDLQNAIDDISANGGGILTISAGNYTFEEINLKSNVHLDISNAVTIRPTSRTDTKNYHMFSLGDNTNPIENISISSSSGNRFTVDLTHNNNPNLSIFKCVKVNNFLLANCNIEDTYTKFSVVTMGGDDFGGNYVIPTNGIVKDMNTNNAHYGYGMVQTQSAENILFKDLSGTGGATLRLETGYTGLNNLQGDNLPVGKTRVGGLDKIVARNISSTNGNCALMVSPHAVHNGTVDAEGITSVNSGFAVRIEGGFVSSKYDQTINLNEGTFEFVKVKNVTATYGDTAEVKSKHFKYYPTEISDPTAKSSYSDKIYIGPSIAPVLADANYSCTGNTQTVIVEEPVVGNGFLYQEDVIPSEFVSLNCASLSTDDFKKKE
ncbi:Iota-carrageenase A2 [Seonamhaeicola marinus]|uniref:Iota-carrageenase A2 n=1 Tax=Seonamhaeicola marinus TaxID=1912246 RepID=A0A5D0HK83_9FLAO|nr:Iota-carrageenase A2 [Seonamhaeicola marinus]TYA71716.1 Iota-carrageenase A2 [Seonamhaeicola marinus]